MKKPFAKLGSKLLTLAVLVGCLSVIAPGRTANAGWFDCLTSWAICNVPCPSPPSPGFEECSNECNQNLDLCVTNSAGDGEGFVIWP
jgi:hypothetical protein